jgi:hypothetical protein
MAPTTAYSREGAAPTAWDNGSNVLLILDQPVVVRIHVREPLPGTAAT